MSLKLKFVFYVVALHLLILLLVSFAFSDFRGWFIALELGMAASVIYGFRLIKRLVEPLEFATMGAVSLKEGDYSTRYRLVGQTEMDRLIQVYNSMLDSLRAERLKLGEQRGFYGRLLNASPMGILIFDFDNRLSSLNPTALSLFRREEKALLGRALREIGSPLAEALCLLSSGQPKVLRIPDGRQLRCQKSSFQDRGFAREFIFLEEVTEELRQSERAAYEKLIRMMSHELNNTVGATNSLLQSCLDNTASSMSDDWTEFRAALEIIVQRNQHMSEFMRRLAETVRIPEPVLQPVDVTTLLKRVCSLLQGECAQRDIGCRWAKEDYVGEIEMDEHLMEQVFLNIMKNAIEAIDHGGTITLSVGVHDSVPEITITDTGGPLSENVQQHLFAPFFTTKKDGQGVGLLVVQEILSKHGYGYSLTDTGEKETTFRIVLGSAASETLN